MRLKKLELFGFKSFADKTQVIFDEGVTCIVGPNGCGKSNISDSIRWVLGERSAKMLRGAKMEDVIFGGTEFRKPLALAEVSLTIDNTDRGLPIDYQEVTLTRRLYRSGESEYFINKTACRLKDIQDLILDTGMGSSTYSMIEQGRIDYILNAEPEERRSLIEEAAGIAKFKVKKEEAIRKLERTEENRLRLNDIVHEVQKNIQYAERQAKRAQRYQEQLEKLKQLEIKKSLFDVAHLDQAENELSTTEQEKLTENQNLETQLQSIRTEQASLNQILTGILDRYSAEENRRHQIQSQITQNEQRLLFHQEKRMSIASRKGQIQQENIQLHERISKSEIDIELKKNEILSLEERKTGFQTTLSEAENEMGSIEERITQTRAHLDHIKSDAFRAATDTARHRNEFHRMIAFLESHEHHKKRNETSKNRLHDELNQWQSKNHHYEGELLRLNESLSELQNRRTESAQRIAALEDEVRSAGQQIADLERQLHEKETSLKMLRELQEQYQGDQHNLLAHAAEELKNQLKELRDILEVREGYEWALESALDAFSKSLVADNADAARLLLDQIRSERKTGIGLLIPWTSEQSAENQPFEHPQVIGALRDVITIKPGYELPFASFVNQVYLLRETPQGSALEEIWSLSDYRKFVSPDGTVIGPGRRIYVRRADLSYEYNHFQRESEIKHLQEAINRLQQEIHALTEREREQSVQLNETQHLLRQLDSALLDSKIQKESCDSHQTGVRDRIASLEKEIQLIDFESSELEMQYQKSIEQKQILEAALMQSESEERNIREKQDSITQDLESVEQAKSSMLRHLTEVRTKYNHLQEQMELIRHSLDLLSEHSAHDRQRVESLAIESGELETKEQSLQAEDESIRVIQDQLDRERRESEVALELIRREKENAESNLSVSREKFEALQGESQHIQNELHQIAIKKMDVNYQKKTIHERMLQSYKVRLNEVAPELYQIEGDFAAIEAEIQQLRDKVESIGTVNLLAIEEYEELKQRYEFLQNQMKDLEQARDTLMETIRHINRTTKNLFQDTFANVQQNFQEYYQTLFRGGVAKLVLLDESNPLESGIDIMVRPPGKKLQNIRLLSGGEKALTAIALLFALFKIKPSPFSVLDEVDAPLDEANVDRFLAVLKTFLKISQFIIVTHNRKTISMGDSLYGVTMEEAGVSKIVSVRVSEDKPIAPPAEPAIENEEPLKDEEPEAEQVSN